MLRRHTLIVAQQAAQTLVTDNLAQRSICFRLCQLNPAQRSIVQTPVRTTSADNHVSTDAIEGSGSLTVQGGSGSGWESGSTFWSYSGSGGYSDGSGAMSIAFLLPGYGSTPVLEYVSGSVNGTAWASGQRTTSDQGSWNATQNSSGNWTHSGTGSTTSNDSNDASYSGSGSFSVGTTASGSYSGSISGSGSYSYSGNNSAGGGTISESGHQDITSGDVSNYKVGSSSGDWLLQSASAGGSDNGSTSWSYSGTANYNDYAVIGSISALPVPFYGIPINSGSVSGTTQTNGNTTTTSQDNWTAGENSSGMWSYSGSGTTTIAENASMSYSGSGNFTQTMVDTSQDGSLSAGGTVTESGYSNTSASYAKTFAMSGPGGWVEQSGSGSGTITWCSGWSYHGSGTYSYQSYSSGSGSGSMSSSGSATLVTGTTSGTGGQAMDPTTGDNIGGQDPNPPSILNQSGQDVPSVPDIRNRPLTPLEWASLPKLSKEAWGYILEHGKDNPDDLVGYIREKLEELNDPKLQNLYQRWKAENARPAEEQVPPRSAPPPIKDPSAEAPQPPKLLPKVSPEEMKQAHQEVEKTIAESKKQMEALQKQVDQQKEVIEAEEKWREMHGAREARNDKKWFFQKYERESEEETRLKRMQLLYDPRFQLNPATGKVEGANAEGRAILKKLERWNQIHNMQTSEKFKEVFETLKKMTDENGKPLLTAEMEKVLEELVKPENLALVGAGVGVGVSISVAGGR